MPNLGMWEILLILFLILLLFGAKRLPEIGRSLGRGIREFKGSLTEVDEQIKEIGKNQAGSDQPGATPRKEDSQTS